jgi:hypothetical protein
MPVISDGVASGLVTAGQTNISVWARRAASALAWVDVFTKIGISSRSQLDRVLPAGPDTAGPR